MKSREEVVRSPEYQALSPEEQSELWALYDQHEEQEAAQDEQQPDWFDNLGTAAQVGGEQWLIGMEQGAREIGRRLGFERDMSPYERSKLTKRYKGLQAEMPKGEGFLEDLSYGVAGSALPLAANVALSPVLGPLGATAAGVGTEYLDVVGQNVAGEQGLTAGEEAGIGFIRGATNLAGGRTLGGEIASDIFAEGAAAGAEAGVRGEEILPAIATGAVAGGLVNPATRASVSGTQALIRDPRAAAQRTADIARESGVAVSDAAKSFGNFISGNNAKYNTAHKSLIDQANKDGRLPPEAEVFFEMAEDGGADPSAYKDVMLDGVPAGEYLPKDGLVGKALRTAETWTGFDAGSRRTSIINNEKKLQQMQVDMVTPYRQLDSRATQDIVTLKAQLDDLKRESNETSGTVESANRVRALEGRINELQMVKRLSDRAATNLTRQGKETTGDPYTNPDERASEMLSLEALAGRLYPDKPIDALRDVKKINKIDELRDIAARSKGDDIGYLAKSAGRQGIAGVTGTLLPLNIAAAAGSLKGSRQRKGIAKAASKVLQEAPKETSQTAQARPVDPKAEDIASRGTYSVDIPELQQAKVTDDQITERRRADLQAAGLTEEVLKPLGTQEARIERAKKAKKVEATAERVAETQGKLEERLKSLESEGVNVERLRNRNESESASEDSLKKLETEIKERESKVEDKKTLDKSKEPLKDRLDKLSDSKTPEAVAANKAVRDASTPNKVKDAELLVEKAEKVDKDRKVLEDARKQGRDYVKKSNLTSDQKAQLLELNEGFTLKTAKSTARKMLKMEKIFKGVNELKPKINSMPDDPLTRALKSDLDAGVSTPIQLKALDRKVQEAENTFKAREELDSKLDASDQDDANLRRRIAKAKLTQVDSIKAAIDKHDQTLKDAVTVDRMVQGLQPRVDALVGKIPDSTVDSIRNALDKATKTNITATETRIKVSEETVQKKVDSEKAMVKAADKLEQRKKPARALLQKARSLQMPKDELAQLTESVDKATESNVLGRTKTLRDSINKLSSLVDAKKKVRAKLKDAGDKVNVSDLYTDLDKMTKASQADKIINKVDELISIKEDQDHLVKYQKEAVKHLSPEDASRIDFSEVMKEVAELKKTGQRDSLEGKIKDTLNKGIESLHDAAVKLASINRRNVNASRDERLVSADKRFLEKYLSEQDQGINLDKLAKEVADLSKTGQRDTLKSKIDEAVNKATELEHTASREKFRADMIKADQAKKEREIEADKASLKQYLGGVGVEGDFSKVKKKINDLNKTGQYETLRMAVDDRVREIQDEIKKNLDASKKAAEKGVKAESVDKIINDVEVATKKSIDSQIKAKDNSDSGSEYKEVVKEEAKSQRVPLKKPATKVRVVEKEEVAVAEPKKVVKVKPRQKSEKFKMAEKEAKALITKLKRAKHKPDQVTQLTEDLKNATNKRAVDSVLSKLKTMDKRRIKSRAEVKPKTTRKKPVEAPAEAPKETPVEVPATPVGAIEEPEIKSEARARVGTVKPKQARNRPKAAEKKKGAKMAGSPKKTKQVEIKPEPKSAEEAPKQEPEAKVAEKPAEDTPVKSERLPMRKEEERANEEITAEDVANIETSKGIKTPKDQADYVTDATGTLVKDVKGLSKPSVINSIVKNLNDVVDDNDVGMSKTAAYKEGGDTWSDWYKSAVQILSKLEGKSAKQINDIYKFIKDEDKDLSEALDLLEN